MVNCARCRRWRPLTDFGAAESYGAMSDACVPCRRAEAPYPEPPTKPAILLRMQRYVASGEFYWAPAFAAWLRAMQAEHGWAAITVWTGATEKNLRSIAYGRTRIVSAGLVDRALMGEGHTDLDDLYPLPEMHDLALAA